MRKYSVYSLSSALFFCHWLRRYEDLFSLLNVFSPVRESVEISLSNSRFYSGPHSFKKMEDPRGLSSLYGQVRQLVVFTNFATNVGDKSNDVLVCFHMKYTHTYMSIVYSQSKQNEAYHKKVKKKLMSLRRRRWILFFRMWTFFSNCTDLRNFFVRSVQKNLRNEICIFFNVQRF